LCHILVGFCTACCRLQDCKNLINDALRLVNNKIAPLEAAELSNYWKLFETLTDILLAGGHDGHDLGPFLNDAVWLRKTCFLFLPDAAC
jgi:hypothetical protein